jgi:hypothetical protein
MKILAGELRDTVEGLREITDKELPVKPAYWLSRLSSKALSELKIFEETRIKLVKKHAKKDDKGKPIFDNKEKRFKIKDENKFTEEYIELAKQEVDLEFDPIKLDALGDVSIKPNTFAKLRKIIVEK